MTPTTELKWHPLELFEQRFQANLAALRTRDPLLADRLSNHRVATPFFISAQGDQVFLGRQGAGGIDIIPDSIPPEEARSMSGKLYPNNVMSWPIVIGGLAYGWLWDRLAKLPCKVDSAPGHRPPICFLTGDIERLWAVMHVMEWSALLADSRFLIYAGEDALAQLRVALIENPALPLPRASVTSEQALWTEDFNSFLESVNVGRGARLAYLAERLDSIYSETSPDEWAAKFQNGRLRVLGVTSRYTTFLQHSMRDWLAAFDRLGHETRLVIEPADYLASGVIANLQGTLDFRPDLILLIDHSRPEFRGMPQSVPCVMWVQDWLPHIFNGAAGPAQGPRDFCIGIGRVHLTQLHGYPAERFMACPMGANELRFTPAALSEQDWVRYGCDVSYVSHASAPSDVLLKTALARNPDPSIAKLLWDFHDRLVGNFEQGGVTHAEWQLKEKLEESIAQTGVQPLADTVIEILRLFNLQVNNAIFRHQALKWVADLGVRLKLYGNDWEKHPTLGRFACGPADTLRDVPKICAASKVNLQLIPHGAVHQRLLEGLLAGGFYLMRWTPGDQLGIAFRSLRNWCLSQGIGNELALRSIDNPQVQSWIAECDELRVDHADKNDFRLYDRLTEGGEAELMVRAGAVWPEEYPQVSFRSAADLQLKLTRFLSDERERQHVASAMRAAIVEKYTYTSLTKRLLRFIATDLRAANAGRSVAA
jgi:hypothetical protein